MHNTITNTHKYQKYLLFIAVIALCSSCKVFNPSQMLRTKANYPYASFADNPTPQEYKLNANDEITVQIFTNNAEKLIDPTQTNTQQQQFQGVTFRIEHDGTCKLPLLGRITMHQQTVREAEKMLETQYSKYFNEPFVKINVISNRVIVFTGGDGGQATVVKLQHPNTTLFEALAMAGGIIDGKAHKVKLIRGDLQNPKVFLIDLSTVQGVTKANLVLQANDIIYVQPRTKVPQKILEGINPYLTLITTILLTIAVFK